MSSILWLILVVVVILWLLGNFALNVGSLINLLLIIVVAILIYQLFVYLSSRPRP